MKHWVEVKNGGVEVYRDNDDGSAPVILARYDLSDASSSPESLSQRIGEIILLDQPKLRAHFKL